MIRARLVQDRSPERQPSNRIRGRSPTYAVAIEMYTIAINRACDESIASALWDVVQREADAENERERVARGQTTGCS